MKILYISKERRDAESGAAALRGVGPNVTVLWASDLGRTAKWLNQAPDLAAVVVEAQLNGSGCALFLTHLRGLGIKSPVIVIGPEEAAPELEPLKAGADAFIAKSHTLLRDLPGVVAHAIERRQAAGTSPAPSHSAELARVAAQFDARLADTEASFQLREQAWTAERAEAVAQQARLERLVRQEREARASLEGELASVRAALAEAEQHRQSAASDVAGQLAERQAQYDIAVAKIAATWEMVDEQLRDAAKEVQHARQEQAAAAAEAERLSHREAELTVQITEARYALDTANERASNERIAAAAQAFQREAELIEQLEREGAKRRGAEEEVARAAAHLLQREAEYETRLAEAAAIRDALDEQARGLTMSLEQARQEAASAARDIERLAQREVDLTARIADLTATSEALENQLANATVAIKEADERTDRERAEAASALAGRQREFDAALAQIGATRDGLAQQLRDAETALERSREEHAAAAGEVDRLTSRASELTARLSETTMACANLERRLAGTQAAFSDATERATRDRLASARKAADREAELDAQIREAHASRVRAEQSLTQAEGVLRDAERRHEAEASVAAAALADLQARFEALSGEASATRETLDGRARALTATLERANRDLASGAAEIERLTGLETGLNAQLAELTELRATLERQLADATDAFKDAEDRRAALEERLRNETAARTEEVARLADRETALNAELAELTSVRAALEQQLTDATSAFSDAEDRRAALEERLRNETAARTEEVARLTDRETALNAQLVELTNIRVGLEQQLADAISANKAAEDRRADLEQRLKQDTERCEALAADLARLEDRRRQEQANYESRLASAADAFRRLSTERDKQIDEQAARHAAALREAESERTRLQESARASLAERTGEVEQLRGQLTATRRELDAAKNRRDALQVEADRLPQLQKRLEESREETRQQFEHAPVALCRCTRDGKLTNANRAFADLVGYRKADDLRGADFAATVFESPDDFSWLVERCLNSKTRESIETTWKKLSGGRLVVRLSAYASAPGTFEIVVEDFTNLRALQERLGQAHRMEAVGRLASEVANTCGNLLREVHQNAQQWLASVPGDTAVRQQGEMLLEEVTRAAGFLRQLAAYGDEETSALAPVELNKVIRDLQPVLKRLAGENVELELPKLSSPLTVDVKAECVERLFVNLASYGRQRMPFGGKLRVELATVVVGEKFIDQHPNCRRGPHAVITVTEIRRAIRATGPLRLHDDIAGTVASDREPDRPGVDLGALQRLISECNGHLWMTVEPPGNMVAKVHLPLRPDDAARQGARVARAGRGRAMARWFQQH
jgi:PAS domain S-box-containing protein